MNDYIQLECKFKGNTEQFEVITAFLAEAGFDMFEDAENALLAYIPNDAFDEKLIKNLAEDFQFEYSFKRIPTENWNEEWEKNFPVINHRNIISVRAPFHNSPEFCKFNIIIEPDMSFGTGHHQTTLLMLDEMLEFDFKNKSVLDMGSGTGILSILAELLQAEKIIAVENDKRAFNNIQLNINHNQSRKIQCLLGSIENVELENVDYVLANISRNVLMSHIKSYFRILNPKGILVMSGFLEEDIPMITDEALSAGFNTISGRSSDEWAVLTFIKF